MYGHTFPEKDWKYMRGIVPELLEELSRRNNDVLRTILYSTRLTENEKRREIFSAVKDGDEVVALCFDDWRRSTALDRCLALATRGLLKPEHLENLTDETRKRIEGYMAWKAE